LLTSDRRERADKCRPRGPERAEEARSAVLTSGGPEGRSVLYPFVSFSREEWARLPADGAFSLSDEEVRSIEPLLSPEEARVIYLPVSRLLYLHFVAAQGLYRAARGFLVGEEREVPFVVGVAGSVASGKSTVAGVLRALISRWPGSPVVELVSTDGFIFPNRVLEERGLMERKGFPESYDLPLLLGFLAGVKSGSGEMSVPIHSHLTYDILPDERQSVGRPDVLVVEGLNMLEAGLPEPTGGHMVFVSDYVDFSIYVDARESSIKKWYLERFLRLREEAMGNSTAYFHSFTELSVDEATDFAMRVWDEIDHPNLKQNIEPTRDRARLILEKGEDHAVRRVRLRKI
jgi:type I pantothenate kinase